MTSWRKLVLMIDPDRLAVHNLNATVAFDEGDVGQAKVAALAKHLNQWP